MILCPKCGKVKTYKIKQTVTREIIYSESGWVCDWKFVKERKSIPRCLKCGRVVKFFKDVEEVEDSQNSDNGVALQMGKKALKQESFKNAYIQAAKERDIAIEQLNELGYSWGEKIEPCNKVRAEIEAQEKWLAEAGYNAYNVGVAFFAIRRALEK